MAAIRHMTARITNDKRNHNILGNFSIFFFNTSIIQIVTSTSANVNIMLFQFGSKNCFVVNRSKGTSEITPNTNKVARYLASSLSVSVQTARLVTVLDHSLVRHCFLLLNIQFLGL